jgi:hypothetical protein
MNKEEAFAVHEAIHNGDASVTIRGKKYPVINRGACRSANVLGYQFMEQNKTKSSNYANLAKKGHKLTWILTQPKWGLIANDKIEIDCPAIVSDSKGTQTASKKRKPEEDDDIEEVQSPPKKQKIEVVLPKTQLPVVKSTPVVTSSAQQSVSGRELLLLVDYKGARKKMQLTAANVQDLAESVRKNLNTNSTIRIEYEDEDFSEFIAVDDLTTLPDKAKVRVVEINPNNTEEANVLPWTFSKDFLDLPGWQEKGYASTKYRSFKIKENDLVYNQAEFDKLKKLFNLHLHGVKFTITKAYAVHNPALEHMFEHYGDKLYNQWRVNPQLFRKEDWKLSKKEHRQWMLNHLENYEQTFTHNASKPVPIVPMIHGTSDKAVWQIIQTGFTTVSTLDEGWYGKGMYFTSYSEYASNYYCRANDEGEKILIITYVTPGNVYPVVEDPDVAEESLKGKPFKNGYQSHYVLVNTQGKPSDVVNDGKIYDELVVFQEAQVIPKYVIHIK